MSLKLKKETIKIFIFAQRVGGAEKDRKKAKRCRWEWWCYIIRVTNSSSSKISTGRDHVKILSDLVPRKLISEGDASSVWIKSSLGPGP